MNIELLFYFLVNYYLVNSGLIFILPLFFGSKENYEKARQYFIPVRLQVFFGFLGIVLSVIVLLFPYTPIIIIGDFAPLVMVLFTSFMYLVSFVKMSNVLSKDKIIRAQMILTSLQIPIGFLNLIVALLHILFPAMIVL